MSLAETFADWGKPADAEALCAELVARSRRCYVQPVALAIAAAAGGIEEQAICHAREAVRVRDPVLPLLFSRHWSHTARLRTYPRFSNILAAARMD